MLGADFDEGQRKQSQDVTGILHDSAVPVLYIIGNDDNVPLDCEDEPIKPLHGRRVGIGDYNFVGYQYPPPFLGKRFVKEHNEIAIDPLSVDPLVDERTILVTHTPAFGSLDRATRATWVAGQLLSSLN